jgi:hypothetical protein
MGNDTTRQAGAGTRYLFEDRVSDADINKKLPLSCFSHATSVMEALLQCQLQVKIKKKVTFNRSSDVVEEALRRCAVSVIHQRVDPVVFCGRMANEVQRRISGWKSIIEVIKSSAVGVASRIAATPPDPRMDGWMVAGLDGSIHVMGGLAKEAAEATAVGSSIEPAFMTRVAECARRGIIRHQEAYCVLRSSGLPACLNEARRYVDQTRLYTITHRVYGQLLFKLFDYLAEKGIEAWIRVLAGV